MSNWIIYIILILCLFSFLKIGAYLILGEVYNFKQLVKHKRQNRKWYLPRVTVLVPSYNDEKTIERTLLSLYESNYPAKKLEVLIANYGTDNTKEIVKEFLKTHRDKCKFRLLNIQRNSAVSVLKYALRQSKFSSLVLFLGADSFVDSNSLRFTVQHFRDRNIIAAALNKNALENGSVNSLAQRYRKLRSYQLNKARSVLSYTKTFELSGSMIRKTMLQKVIFFSRNVDEKNLYSALEFIAKDLKTKQKIGYAGDSLVYTEPVSLMQSMQKNIIDLKDKPQTLPKNLPHKLLSKKIFKRFYMWSTILVKITKVTTYTFGPLILGYFMFNSLRYNDSIVYISISITASIYLLMNVWASNHLSFKSRVRLTYYAPPMFLIMYIFSLFEYSLIAKRFVLSIIHKFHLAGSYRPNYIRLRDSKKPTAA